MRKSKITKLVVAVSALALAVAMSVGMVSAAITKTSVEFKMSVSAAHNVKHSPDAVKGNTDTKYSAKITSFTDGTGVGRLRVRAWNVDKGAKASIFHSIRGVNNYNYSYDTTPKKGAICRLDGDVSAEAVRDGGYMAGTFTP